VWFLGGVLRKVGAKRGFLMGGTWFLGGKTWWFAWCFCGEEKYANFLK
jgi:hypothetical protein